MVSSNRITVSGRALAIALLAPMAALGQTAAPGRTPSDGLEEIVVTANRYDQPLQVVPLSITALTGTDIVNQHVESLQDLQTSLPSLHIATGFTANNPTFAIRGQTQTDTNVSVEPSVGIYQDEVTVARSQGALGDLVDVSSVEVLNGPQGTLFGRNTTGGAIVISSVKPVDDFEGWLSGSYASGDLSTVKGAINFVLVPETVLLRVAGEVENKKGFTNNAVTNEPIDHNRKEFVRSIMTIKPNDRLNIELSADYTHDNGGGLNSQLISADSAPFSPMALEAGLWLNRKNPFAALTPAGQAAASAYINNLIALGHSNPYEVYESHLFILSQVGANGSLSGGQDDPYYKQRTGGVSANVQYDFGPLTLKSISAYRFVEDTDVENPVPVPFWFVDDITHVSQHQLSQEFLLNGKTLSDRLNWTVGTFFFTEGASDYTHNSPLALVQLYLAPPGTSGDTYGTNLVSHSYAVFSQETYNITDQLSLTVGGRETRDSRLAHLSYDVDFPGGAQACIEPITDAPGECRVSGSHSFNKFTYNAQLAFQVDADKMVYARTSSGYRAGGFSPRTSSPVLYQPELLTDYEVGVKTDWLDHHVRLNLALFHDKETDIQQSTTIATAPLTLIDPNTGVSFKYSTTGTLTFNSGKGTVTGVDLTAQYEPVRWLTLTENATYLHTTFTSAFVGDPNTILPYAPSLTSDTGVMFNTPIIRGAATAAVGLDWYHTGNQNTSDSFGTNPASTFVGANVVTLPGYNLLNAALTITDQHSGASIALYGRNLTDKLYAVRGLGIAAGLNTETFWYGDPRTVGIEVRVPFGGKGK